MLASSKPCTCCSTQVPSTRSSSRNPRCLLRYTSLHSDSGFNEGEQTEPQARTRVRYGHARTSHAPVEEAAAALVGGEVDRGGGGALLGGRRGRGGREGRGEEALCGGGGGGRGEHAAEVQRAAEQRGRHGSAWVAEGKGRGERDREIGRPPTASETGCPGANVLTWLLGGPETLRVLYGPGAGPGRRLRFGLVRERRGSEPWVRLGSSWAGRDARGKRFYRTSLNYCPIYPSCDTLTCKSDLHDNSKKNQLKFMKCCKNSFFSKITLYFCEINIHLIKILKSNLTLEISCRKYFSS